MPFPESWPSIRPLIVLAWYLTASAIAFMLYTVDKHHAVIRRERIPERTLHLVELLGGWPGAYLAQRALRHKTRKTTYQTTFWLIVATHLVGWWIVLSRPS